KKKLAIYQKKWPDLPAKWTPKDNLHITLEFLGDLTDVEIGEVCKIVNEVAKRHKNFDIVLNKVLYGPPNPPSRKASDGRGKMPPRMVWVEGEKSDELLDLKNDLQECLLEKVSYRPEAGRGFATHITLARILEWEFRKIEPEERPEINEEIDYNIPVESIEVMESELHRGGPVYTILESHELGI
ncbi:MAG: RNA 2',3'-cyclic phosphodiesterase, partial [Patescibacteria group bacterium]